MFSLLELKTAVLDSGVHVSQMDTILLILMMIALPMIPYLFLYPSFRDEERREAKVGRASHLHETTPFGKTIAWLRAHRHPQLLHH